MADYRLLVQSIMAEWRQGETHRWRAAELVYAAYDELHADHHEGLTRALEDALILGADQIRNLRRACELVVRLEYGPSLTVTHYSRIYGLQLKYNLTDDQVRDYLDMADTEHWDVAKMSTEVERNHDPDPALSFRRHQARLVKALRRWYDESETWKIPDVIRAAIKAALVALEKG